MHLLMLLIVVVQMATASFYSLLGPHPGPYSTYLYSICAPNGTVNNPDFPKLNYPCNLAIGLSILCETGDITGFLPADIGGTTDSRPARVPNSKEQQQCICASSFFDQMHGCVSCLSRHGGGTVLAAYLSEQDLLNMKSAYCQHSSDAKTGFSEMWNDWTVGKHAPEDAKSALSLAARSSYTDPLGSTRTAVSLYYSPSVTGAAALGFALVQPATSAPDTILHTKTSGGYANTTEGGSVPTLHKPTPTSSASTHGNGNMSTIAKAHKNHTSASMLASVAAGTETTLYAYVAGLVGVAVAITLL